MSYDAVKMAIANLKHQIALLEQQISILENQQNRGPNYPTGEVYTSKQIEAQRNSSFLNEKEEAELDRHLDLQRKRLIAEQESQMPEFRQQQEEAMLHAEENNIQASPGMLEALARMRGE